MAVTTLYPIPNHLGVVADKTNRKALEENIRTAVQKNEKAKQATLLLADRLKGLEISISARAAEESKLFGSLTAPQLVKAVNSTHALDLHPAQIIIKAPIRDLGAHEVMLALHEAIEVPLKVQVIAL